MDVEVLINQFPAAWRQLFHIMRKYATNPWEKMDEYFCFEFKSQYVEKQSSIAELVSHMCMVEPILQDGKIKRVPRLFHFPDRMQRHLVWFIYRHKRELSMSSICQLVQLLSEDFSVGKDKTLGTALSLFNSLAKKKTASQKHQENCYTFSKENEERAAALIRRFSGCVNKQETSPESLELQTCLDDEEVEVVQHSIKGSQPSFVEICTPEGDSVLVQASTSYNEAKNTDNIMKSGLNESKISGTPCSQTLSGSSRKRNISLANEDAKQRKIGDAEVIKEGLEETLPADLHSVVLNLRDSWISADPNSSQAADFSVLDKLSESEMRAACRIMELSELTDAGCATACNQLATKSGVASFCNISVFAEHCILPKLQSLEDRCLRVLLDALITFGEKYHRQMAACVFVPLLKTDELNQYQASVINEVMKEGCNEDQKIFFLSSATRTTLPWTEVTVSVFHPLINCKLKFSPDDCHNLLSRLSEASSSLGKNLKFTKLLISFIKIYASQLNTEDLQTLQHMVNVNTTFLKTAAVAALKKNTAK